MCGAWLNVFVVKIEDETQVRGHIHSRVVYRGDLAPLQPFRNHLRDREPEESRQDLLCAPSNVIGPRLAQAPRFGIDAAPVQLAGATNECS
jgi:hypothetical protein